MREFDEEVKLKALTRAYKENILSKRLEGGFVFGINDCFTLAYRYDKALRGVSKLKAILTGYTSNEHFFKLLDKHFGSIEVFLEKCSFKEVTTPSIGDVAVIRDMQDSYTVAIKQSEELWITSSVVENKDKLSTEIVERRLVKYFSPVMEN